MGVILWIIFGAFVGWVGSMIMKTDAQQGAIANVVIGIIGALLGGYTWTLATGDRADSLAGQLILAIIGSMIVIAAWRAISPKV